MKTLQETIEELDITVQLVSYEKSIADLGSQEGGIAFTELYYSGGANGIILDNGQRIVQVIDGLARFLGDERLEALVAHEVGHHLLGHIAPITPAGLIGAKLEDELAADAYAVMLFGKKIVRETFEGLFRWCIKTATLGADEDALKIWHDAMKDPIMVARFEALQ